MAFITRFTGNTEERNIRLNQSVSGIMLTSDQPITDEIIYAQIRSRHQDDVNVFPNLFVSELAEIASREVGFHINGDGGAELYLEIGNGSAFKMSEDEELFIEFRNLNPDANYSLFQYVDGIITNNVLTYETKQVREGTTSIRANLEMVSRMFLRINDSLTTVTINYPDTSIDLDVAELRIINRRQNDIVSANLVDGMPQFGIAELLEIPDAGVALNVTITTDGSEDLVYLVEKPLDLKNYLGTKTNY